MNINWVLGEEESNHTANIFFMLCENILFYVVENAEFFIEVLAEIFLCDSCVKI